MYNGFVHQGVRIFYKPDASVLYSDTQRIMGFTSKVLSVLNPQPYFLIRPVLWAEERVLPTSSSGRWLVSAPGNAAPSPDVVAFIQRTGSAS